MHIAVVSDVHLGSTFFLRDRFLAFLAGLPPGTTLVLNGDTIDRCQEPLTARDRIVLDSIIEQSSQRPVVWIHGNHDEDYHPPASGNIQFLQQYEVGKRLFISHGHDFDNVMPRNRLFINLFRFMHRIRILLGAEPMHVALYAKKWAFLYKVLRDHIRDNAVEHAQENGFETVACGHTHYMEDLTAEGIRYINTGSWTEEEAYWISIDDDTIELKSLPTTTGS